MRRQLEEERVMREQAMREAALARNAPQVANPAPQQNPIPTQVAPPQEVQVPPQVTHQVQDMASQAVEAFRAPAQSAASAFSLVFGRKKGLSEAPLLPGGMDISLSHLDHCMAARFHQPHPGGMGLCHQASPLSHRFTRLLRHQTQAHRRAAP